MEISLRESFVVIYEAKSFFHAHDSADSQVGCASRGNSVWFVSQLTPTPTACASRSYYEQRAGEQK